MNDDTAEQNTPRKPDVQSSRAFTGQETDEELRELIVRSCRQIPDGEHEQAHVFRVLGGLSNASLNNLVAGMNRKQLLALFKLEQEDPDTRSD